MPNSRFIVEDSSFVVALMNKSDALHERALLVFRKLYRNYSQVRIVVPTPVIFESLFALMRAGVDHQIAQEKLWKFLMVLNVLNFTILETTAIRFAPRIGPLLKNLNAEASIPANDLIIIATSFEFEDAPIITFDVGMKRRFNAICGGRILDMNDDNDVVKLFKYIG